MNYFSYKQRTAQLVSNTVSNSDEITRWLLDWHGISFQDQRHGPGLHIGPANKAAGVKTGIANNPVYTSTDTLTWGKDGYFKYIEARSSEANSLLPTDEKEQAEAKELYEYFWESLWRPAGRYVYKTILPYKDITYPLVTQQIPWWEKMTYKLFYKTMAKALYEGLELGEYSTKELLDQVEEVFQRVESRLTDGRKYLVGDTFSIADMFLAVMASPLILPPEFSGALIKPEGYPDELREKVIEYRNRPIGKFVLRMFKDHRVQPYKTRELKRTTAWSKFTSNLNYALFGPHFLVKTFRFLIKRPVWKLGKYVVFTPYSTVTKLLNQDEIFTVKQTNGIKMDALGTPFFLGMDRSPQHDREQEIMRKIVKREDLDNIRTFVRNQANDLVALTAPYEKVDVVASVTRPVLIRLLDYYFGMACPTEPMGMQWMRDFFHDLFLNLGNDKTIHQNAQESANQMKEWILQLVESRRKLLQEGGELPDNLLNRLIGMQDQYDWLDDDTICRNIMGTTAGTVETISKAVVLVLDELFRRPNEFALAATAAGNNEMEVVRRYAYEALRFNPFNPIVIRYSTDEQLVEIEGKKKPCKVKAGSLVYAALAPAMFDKQAFPEPGTFNPNRDVEYLHFGYGYHECYGKHINAVVIPELVSAFLRLSNLRRAKGVLGKRGLREGPFPNNFVVEYDFNAF